MHRGKLFTALLAVLLAVPLGGQTPPAWDLEACVAQALKANKDYLIAELNVKKAEAEEKAAFAGLLPSLSFSGSYTRLDSGSVMDLGGGIVIPMSFPHNTKLGLTVAYPVPFIPYLSDGAWGAASKGHKIAREQHRLAQEKLKKIRIDTRVKVAKFFYGVLLNSKALELTVANRRRLQSYVEVAQRMFAAGQVSQYELLRTQVQLANIIPVVLQTENQLRLARVSLLQAMGLPLDVQFTLQGKLGSVPVSITEQEAITRSLRDRYEFKELAGTERILVLSRELQRAANRPVLAVFGNLNWAQAGDSAFSGGLESSWNAGIQLSIPISELFPWSKTRNKVKAADLDVTIIKKTIQNVEEQIRLQIRQIVLRLDEHRKTIEAQQVAVQLSTRGLEIARVRFANGQMGNVELMDAELDYQQATLNYNRAQFDYINDVHDLLQAIGAETL